MKGISCLLYEIDVDEIKTLPKGWQVLRYDTLYESYRIMHAGEDVFRQQGKRYVFFIFKAPPLPQLAGCVNQTISD